ncbi:MAG: DNA recombination protein RmuC [Proteobacteria bacterium]|nr:DNA recombination protein RmuC [Pseudomonadota bacterium]NCA27844.1 DNA recombination protein RmuC [Pseudomonadota bacterium]
MFLILSLFVNILLISGMVYILKQNRQTHGQFEVLKQEIGHKNIEISINLEKLSAKNNECQKYQNIITEISEKKDNLEKTLAEVQAFLVSSQQNLQNTSKKLVEFEEKNHALLDKCQNLGLINGQLESKSKYLHEKIDNQKKEVEDLQKTFQLNFENLANKILQEKSEKFTEINKLNILQILEPLGQNINNFKKQVADTYDKDSKERLVLQEQIKSLFEQTNKVSSEANNLASALKGNSKKQGNWGEMVLETILQHSGLQRDIHYFKEKSFNNDEGKNLRPDFQIHLPDNRLIVTDSKVSLNAYNKFCESTNEIESQKYLDDHLKSVKNHIDNLAEKKYDELERSLDFTIMFMPVEPAYLLAIQSDKNLWAFAYSKRILLVSPTNLIACLKIIDDLWKREMQSKNAMAIVNRGEKLYSKFVSFTESLLEIGRKLDASKDSYDNAVRQLREGNGNLLSQAEKLKNLGLKSDKKIPIDFEISSDDES